MATRAPTLLLMAVVLVLPACRGGATPAVDEDSTRVTAVQQAREEVAGPAQRLGTAAMAVRRALDEVQSDPDTSAVDELAAALDDVAGATGDLGAVDLDASTVDVRAAAAAVDRATTAAEGLARAGGVLLETGRQLATTDTRLEELTADWDQRGSRSELLAHLEETATSAEALVAEGPEGCPGPMEVRSAAATFVADASRSLKPLVSAHDGEGYDARRAELEQAPYGRTDDDEPRRLDGLADADPCPVLERARSAADGVEAALQDLEDALNPSDLAS